jgi:hypothetical protein
MESLALPDPTIESASAAEQNRPAIWGPLATLLWGVLIAIVFLVVQIVAALV